MSYEIILDNYGAPAVALEKDLYIHVIPVTKYQFERYVWEEAPKEFNMDSLNWDKARVSPNEIDSNNLGQLWVNNVSFEEALDFACWNGGRLPTKKEWIQARQTVWAKKGLLDKTKKAMAKSSDSRLIEMMDRISLLTSTREELVGKKIGELASEYPAPNFGNIALMFMDNSQPAYITGTEAISYKKEDCSFCCIFERKQMSNENCYK